jgi:hypothetical protein
METKNLSELSERELEFKEKSFKASFYLLAAVGTFGTLTVIISSYMTTGSISLGWKTLLFVTFIPLYLTFQAKKQLNEIKSEFERRRYR